MRILFALMATLVAFTDHSWAAVAKSRKSASASREIALRPCATVFAPPVLVEWHPKMLNPSPATEISGDTISGSGQVILAARDVETGSGENEPVIWHYGTGEVIEIASHFGPGSSLFLAAVTPDGNTAYVLKHRQEQSSMLSDRGKSEQTDFIALDLRSKAKEIVAQTNATEHPRVVTSPNGAFVMHLSHWDGRLPEATIIRIHDGAIRRVKLDLSGAGRSAQTYDMHLAPDGMQVVLGLHYKSAIFTLPEHATARPPVLQPIYVNGKALGVGPSGLSFIIRPDCKTCLYRTIGRERPAITKLAGVQDLIAQIRRGNEAYPHVMNAGVGKAVFSPNGKFVAALVWGEGPNASYRNLSSAPGVTATTSAMRSHRHFVFVWSTDSNTLQAVFTLPEEHIVGRSGQPDLVLRDDGSTRVVGASAASLYAWDSAKETIWTQPRAVGDEDWQEFIIDLSLSSDGEIILIRDRDGSRVVQFPR